jgi:Lectin C-type domain
MIPAMLSATFVPSPASAAQPYMSAVKQSLSCLAVSVSLAIGGVGNAVGAVISPAIVNPDNRHTYLLLATDTWAGSEGEAISLGGHLVTINNASEQTWVFQKFSSYLGLERLLWIGLNDVANEGTFVWSSGEPVVFTFWEVGEPNNNSPGVGEDYVSMYHPSHPPAGRWNDWRETTSHLGMPFNGVVEIIPEPGVSLLLILAMVVK